MAKSRLQKKETSTDLAKEFASAKSVAFANYQGMTVVQADSLRKKAREAGVTYIVAKKTLLTRAAKEAGIDLNAKGFVGMIGAAFGHEDEIAPAKVLGDMMKVSPLKLVGGVFEGKSVDQEKIVALSKLPSKQQLLQMLVGTIAAPMSAFVRTLDAIRQDKEKVTA